MTDIQPPLNRPTPEQMQVWEEWTEKELLVAQVLRLNAIAGMMVQMANAMPDALQAMRNPLIARAMKLMIRPDKSNE